MKCLGSILTLTCVLVPHASAQCGAQWLSGLLSPDFNGTPTSAVEWDPDGPGPHESLLVFTGPFTKAGKLSVPREVAWNGHEWQKLQGDQPYNGTSLTNPLLYAFGAGLYAVDQTFVYRWNGAGWNRLTNIAGVQRLAMHNGALVAFGALNIPGPAHVLARLDGETWTPIDPPLKTGFSQTINDLTVVDGQLMIGGRFFLTDASAYTNFASFDGSTWSNGASLPGILSALRFYSAGGQLYVTTSSNIYARSGSSWTAIPGWSGSNIVVAQGPNGRLCMSPTTGNFPVSEWNGTAWTSIGSALSSGSTPSGLVSSRFGLVSFGNYATRISIYNGFSWGPLSESFAGLIGAFGQLNGQLIAGTGGKGLSSSNFLSNYARIAKWNGLRFETIGSSPHMTDDVVTGLPSVNSFASVGNDVFVSGSFNEFKNAQAGGLLELSSTGDVSTPAPLLQYSDLTVSPAVYAAVSFQGKLHAIGRFNSSAGHSLSNIARLGEAGWEWPDAGLPPRNPGGVATAAIVFNNELVVSGAFDFAGDVAASNVARWNGGHWHEMGNPPGGFYAFAIYNNELYGAGKLVVSGTSYYLAKWSGSQWQPIAGPLQGSGYALVEYQGNLIVGGETTTGTAILHKWDGTSLTEFAAQKPSGKIYALVVDHGELTVGGDFSLTVSGVSSNHFARWSPDGIPWIAQQPEPAVANCGRNLVFTVAPALGYTKYTGFHWRRNGVDLFNGVTPSGSVIAGASTSFLSISNVSSADAGEYDCVVSSTSPSCPAVTTQSATATVLCCPADFTGDLLVDDADFQTFVVAYNALECTPVCPADLNSDNVVDDSDFQIFVQAYNALICE